MASFGDTTCNYKYFVELNVLKAKFEALSIGVAPQYSVRMLLLLTKEIDFKYCRHRLALALKIILESSIF